MNNNISLIGKAQNNKQLLLFAAALVYVSIFTVACHRTRVNQQETPTNAILNVYFFHLTERCDACTAIEENTRKVLAKYFSEQLNNGKIVFRSINIEKRENKNIAEKYQVSYTSLLLIRADGDVTDFTNSSMNYANMNPSKFEELLKAEIDKNLN